MTQLQSTFGKAFWDDTLVRVLKTFAQALLGTLGVAAFGVSTGLASVDWLAALSIAGASALAALLMAVAGAQSAAQREQKSVATGETPEGYVPERALEEPAEGASPQRTKTIGL